MPSTPRTTEPAAITRLPRGGPDETGGGNSSGSEHGMGRLGGGGAGVGGGGGGGGGGGAPVGAAEVQVAALDAELALVPLVQPAHPGTGDPAGCEGKKNGKWKKSVRSTPRFSKWSTSAINLTLLADIKTPAR